VIFEGFEATDVVGPAGHLRTTGARASTDWRKTVQTK